MNEKIEIHDELVIVSRNMEIYGGSFEQNLGRALCHADSKNTAKIKATWPELWEKFLNWDK